MIMMDIVRELLKQHPSEQIFYITAELPAMAGIPISELWDIYQQLHPSTSKQITHWLIDEIQELPNWQSEVKYMHDQKRIKFYITGSSSLILNQKSAKLTGRFILTHVLPLDFTEFLTFTGRSLKKNQQHNQNLVNDYLDTGGYPEYVLSGNDTILVQTVESVMYRDLLSLYGIRNPAILKDILRLLCDKVGTPVSFNNVADDLKVDVQTAQFYLKYLQDVYLIYPLFRRGKSHKIVKGFIPKYYLNDTGILRLFSQTPRIGHLAENAIFLRLKSLQASSSSEPFYDYVDGREVDFIFNQQHFDVKMKPIETGSEKIIYIVAQTQPDIGWPQIELWKFLSDYQA